MWRGNPFQNVDRSIALAAETKRQATTTMADVKKEEGGTSGERNDAPAT